MPVNFLNESERTHLSQIPADILEIDLNKYFTLTPEDIQQVKRQRQPHNQLGFAIQLCTLRFLGFCPDDLQQTPAQVLEFVAQQINITVEHLQRYGKRAQTRTAHLQQVQHYLGFRTPKSKDLKALGKWMLERALEHDEPLLLFQQAAEKLLAQKLVRPRITTIERMVSTARNQAMKVTYQMMKPLVKASGRKFLNDLLKPEGDGKAIRLSRLRWPATSNSAAEILRVIEKINFLRSHNVHQWDVTEFNPNRLKFLARLAKKTSIKSFKRIPIERRYPLLIAFLQQLLIETTDEAIDLFIRCLSDAHSKARRELRDFRQKEAVAINEKVMLLQQLGGVILDPAVEDPAVRSDIFECVSPEQLQAALADCERIVRPAKDESYDYFANRYSYIRQFAPAFLSTFEFHSHRQDDPLLKAINHIRELDASGQRQISEDAPMEFVTEAWQEYIYDEQGQIKRRYYELCVLWELRHALSTGALWIEGARRYANPESYLIPRQKWEEMRSEFCQFTGLPETGAERLAQLSEQLEAEMTTFVDTLQQNPDIRLEEEHLVISPLDAEEESPRLQQLKVLVEQCMPQVELTELLIEVDELTHFSDALIHTGGNANRTDNTKLHLYASLLSQACNLGPAAMARGADLSYDSLLWHTNWYLDETNLRNANTMLVNYHHQLPLTKAWGGGTLSSSDGQRFPVAVKNAKAVPLPKYFGYGRGVTFYTWLSDQFSQYGIKVIPSTKRDATYLLDGIQDNETELTVLEHTTDTTGYSEVVFSFFDLCGYRFSPRIRDLADQTLYRLSNKFPDPLLKPLFKGRCQQQFIIDDWDEMLRTAASLKYGWVSSSLLMNKLQSLPDPHHLLRAFHEYGRLLKTIFILQYLNSKDYRRRINRQLNKGESVHTLRRYFVIAQQGELRKRHQEGLENQASCLTLVTNAVVVWNTIYLNAALEYIERQGYVMTEEDKSHLSPARCGHINPYGKFSFDIPKVQSLKGLRPLNTIKKANSQNS